MKEEGFSVASATLSDYYVKKHLRWKYSNKKTTIKFLIPSTSGAYLNVIHT